MIARQRFTGGAGRLAAVALVATACVHPAVDPPPAAERPDILLITVDTLRADRLGCYGYPRPTSPVIDGLAAGGVRFDRAYSTSSWTVPAVVSMLTATYPARHGMGERANAEAGRWHVIPADLPSLPETLRNAGYRTYGLTANFGLTAERGFARGFDRYRSLGAVDLGTVEREIEPWFRDLETEGPWFFWLHLFDPHAPYVERPAWIETLRPEGGPRDEGATEVSAEAIVRATPDDPLVQRAQALYDSEIRDLDAYLGRFFDRLPRARDAFLLFTADHGEEFFEHGGALHGRTLYDEVTRIPLVLRHPDRAYAGTVVDEPVSLVDVLPTLLAAARVEAPAAIAGTSLLDPSALDARGRRAVFAELERGSAWRAVVDGRWKYVVDGSTERLFDLDADPAENVDLAANHPDLIASFRRLSRRYDQVTQAPETPLEEVGITAAEREALETLGYLH